MQATAFRLWVIVLLTTLGTAPATAEDKLYLAEYKYNDPKLYCMNLDGSDVEELSIIPATDWLPLGLQIDTADGKIYWTHGSYTQGRIRRANLDGSDIETLVSGLTNPRGLAIDFAGGKMYWSDTQDNTIYRANIDGSGMEAIVSEHQYGRPTLDAVNGRVYFGDFGSNVVRRCNLDGSSIETVITNGVDQANGIALDLDNDKIYWTDMQTSFVTNYVARANLDDTGFEVLYQGLGTSSGLMNIELDLSAGKMYWADEITEEEKGVWRANLDGSGAERIYVSPVGWNAGVITLVLDSTPPCPDLDGDGDVDLADLAILLAHYGTPDGASFEDGDIDGDGDIDLCDLAALLSHYGDACP